MFTRNSDREAPPGAATAPTAPPMPPAATAVPSPAKPPPVNGNAVTSSVIGRDLTIIGSGLKIVSRGLLQVDGEVQGDVIGQKIVIGPTGKVTGLVNAEDILVQGAVFGTIKAVDVKLAASSVVEGDLYHQTFSLEQGAGFEGRSRRAATREELVPDLDALAPIET
jgi:cytoskeletal protein CcmA (bactofilin family)